MKYILLLSLFCIIQPSVCFGQNSYVTELEVAQQLSKETKQNILLIFSADWCSNCQNLKNDLPDMEYMDRYIICILDFDTNKKLSRKLNIKNLPTSIVMKNDLQETHRIIGYEKRKYVEWLKERSVTK